MERKIYNDGTMIPPKTGDTLIYDVETDNDAWGYGGCSMNSACNRRCITFKIYWEWWTAMPRWVWEHMDDYGWISTGWEVGFNRVPEDMVDKFAENYFRFVQQVKADQVVKLEMPAKVLPEEYLYKQ